MSDDSLHNQVKIIGAKNVLLEMWHRVNVGDFDSRSFVGDKALSLRDILYGQSDDELKEFWYDYDKWKENNE